MSYKNNSWNNFNCSYLKTFGQEVPIYQPSVYREFRGEIFTTFHSLYHPVMNLVDKDTSVHSRFSRSYQNTLRGLHYDFVTGKLVQAIVGEIYLVVLDVRENSSTYGKWESYIISERTRDQVYIPPGFANGHYALTDCIFHYNLFYTGSYVDERSQFVIKWNDPKYKIEWPSMSPTLQERDR